MKLLVPVLLLAGAAGSWLLWRPLGSDLRGPAIVARATAPSFSGTAPAPGTVGSRQTLLDPRRVDAADLAQALRSGRREERNRAYQDILPQLVAQDGALAGHFALAWEPGSERDELLRQVVRLRAASDLGGTITWLASLLDDTDRQTAGEALVQQVARSDRAGAVELTTLLHLGIDDGSLEHLVQIWTEDSPTEAVDWIMTQPGGLLRDRLLARIAHVRAQRDPAEAAQLVLEFMPAGPAQDAALVGVVRQWAMRDPANATTWVNRLPASSLYALARQELAAVRIQ